MAGVTEGLWIAIAVVVVLLVAALVVGLVRYRRRQVRLSSPDTATPLERSGYTTSSGITFSQSAPAEPVERIDTTGLPGVGDDATIPRDAPKRSIADVQLPEAPVEKPAEPTPPVAPAPVAEPAAPPAEPAEPAAPPAEPAVPVIEEIAPPEGRLERLRGRLA